VIFEQPARDEVWESELKSRHVISQPEFLAFQDKPIGHLMELLYLNAHLIRSKPFLEWLIRDHGFVRFSPPHLDHPLIEEWTRTNQDRDFLLSNFVYPLQTTRFTCTVGMSHPEDPAIQEPLRRLFKKWPYLQILALTPEEAKGYHAKFENA